MSLTKRAVLAVASAVAALLMMGAYAAAVKGEAADQRSQALQRYGGETAYVCVASRPIAPGEAFSERNVESVEWLVDLLPEGALTDPALLDGKTSSSAIARNTPLSQTLVDDDSRAIEVPPGLAALSIPCSAQTAVGGAIAPNSIVDVYIVTEGTARVLARGARVLQTGAGLAGSSQSWATIAVPGDLVEAAVAASAQQRLYLVLPSDSLAEGPSRDMSVEQGGRDGEGDVPPVGGD